MPPLTAERLLRCLSNFRRPLFCFAPRQLFESVDKDDEDGNCDPSIFAALGHICVL